MKILVNTDTKRVIVALEDTATLSIEANRVVTDRAIYATLNASNAAVYTNTQPPTLDPNRYTYDAGTDSYQDTWPYKELTKVEFLDQLQDSAGVTDTQLVQARDDAHLAAFWLKFSFAETIQRDDPKVGGGLDALVALGYLDAAGREAVIANWPRVSPAALRR